MSFAYAAVAAAADFAFIIAVFAFVIADFDFVIVIVFASRCCAFWV